MLDSDEIEDESVISRAFRLQLSLPPATPLDRYVSAYIDQSLFRRYFISGGPGATNLKAATTKIIESIDRRLFTLTADTLVLQVTERPLLAQTFSSGRVD